MNIELLIKLLILLLSEYKVNNRLNSISLAKKILKETEQEKRAKVFNDETDLLDKIRDLIKNIADEKIVPDEELLINIELMLSDKPALMDIIKKYTGRKDQAKVVSNLLLDLNSQLKKISSKKLLKVALSRISVPSTDTDLILEELLEKLNDIKTMREVVTTGLVDRIDFNDADSVTAIAKRAADLVSGGQALKTGWSCLNNMTQDGLRRGEFVTVTALQHNYKSSFVKSLFLQLARLNKPELDDPDKKPLLLFISLEEEVDNIMSFFYLYLKHSIDGVTFTRKQQKELDPNEVRDYILKHLSNTGGYNIEVLRFRPEMLTYSVLFDTYESYKKKGFEIHGVVCDYVKKMNRAGCDRNGPMGTDLLELYSRLRNFFSSEKCLFLTPHQLSTAAKQLTRNGIPPVEFVKHVCGKGYYADSSQLDQEIDLELFLNLATINKTTYLTVARGKHRIPTVIPEDDKFLMLEFTDKVSPIREDSEDFKACRKEVKEENEFEF